MRSTFKFFIVAISILSSTISCGTLIQDRKPDFLTKVEIIPSEASVQVGDFYQLSYKMTPEKYEHSIMKWSSNDNKIASVDQDGEVYAIAAGKTAVTLVIDGVKASCEVTVHNEVVYTIDNIYFKGYEENEDVEMVDQGATKNLTVVFVPDYTLAEKTLEWKSSDESLATVAASGEGTARVTFAKGKTGKVTITAKSPYCSTVASKTFLVLGSGPLYTAPKGKVYAGEEITVTFNRSAYPGATGVKWTYGDSKVEGDSFTAVLLDEKTEILLSLAVSGTDINTKVEIDAREWIVNAALPNGRWSKNSYPVFSVDGKKAYFVTLGSGTSSQRYLYEIDIENNKLGWNIELASPNGFDANGGNLCVNPLKGDIITCSNSEVYAITSSGTKRWTFISPYADTNHGSFSVKGSGPMVSNDCRTIFVPADSKGFYALDATSGEVLSSLDVSVSACEGAVVDNNTIILLDNSRKIQVIEFKEGKLSIAETVDSGLSGLSDITSPAVYGDYIYFFGNGGGLCRFDINTHAVTKTTVQGVGGYLWAGCITPDGYLAQASQNVCGIIKTPLSNINGTSTAVWTYTANASGLNFSGVSCDEDSSVHFYMNDSSDSLESYFATIDKDGKLTKTGVLPSVTSGTYQGAFNFCGHYLVAIAGKPGTVLVHYNASPRAAGWSGNGGDPQATKNVSLIFGK